MLKLNEIKTLMEKNMTGNRGYQQGLRYYYGKHDILSYRVFFYNSDGKLVEDTQNQNTRISHPFFTELVDQQVQYMLSNKESYVCSDIPELQDELDSYFDDEFVADLNELLTGVIIKGSDYLYVYKNAEGKLSFQYAEIENVVEVKAIDSPDHEDHIIYSYKPTDDITKVQVWDKDQVSFYVLTDDKGIEFDKDYKINPQPHIVWNDGESESFGVIPFFRLDNNKKRISNLDAIKDIIDDYDMMNCGFSNNLNDFDNPMYIVKGFEGDNLEELQQNLRTKKMIGVDSDGGVEVKTVDIPYQARMAKMSEDEKNIYKFGMGFNSAQIGDGNITNIVIKSRYALLDLKSNKLEVRLRRFLKPIVKMVLKNINDEFNTDYQMKDIYFDFEREVMTNAQDNATIAQTEAATRQIEINTIMTIAQVIDDDTILQKICDTLDLDITEVELKPDEVQEAYDDLDDVNE